MNSGRVTTARGLFTKPGSLAAFLDANARHLATWPPWKRAADALGRPRDPWRAESRALAEALFGWLREVEA